MTVTALAGLVGAVPHVVAGRALGLDVLARRVLAVALAALLFRPLYDGGPVSGPSGAAPRTARRCSRW